MARSATITTAIPTLEEFGKSLGLSKRRHDSLLKLVYRNSTSSRFIAKNGKTSGVTRGRKTAKS